MDIVVVYTHMHASKLAGNIVNKGNRETVYEIEIEKKDNKIKRDRGNSENPLTLTPALLSNPPLNPNTKLDQKISPMIQRMREIFEREEKKGTKEKEIEPNKVTKIKDTFEKINTKRNNKIRKEKENRQKE